MEIIRQDGRLKRGSLTRRAADTAGAASFLWRRIFAVKQYAAAAMTA